MRQVGITGKNLLSLYFTTLAVGLASGCGKLTPDAKGDVAETSAPSGDTFCIEPVRSITVSASISKDIYFVPAFDFKGIKINGSDITTTSVVADGESLYKLAAAGTVSKVSL